MPNNPLTNLRTQREQTLEAVTHLLQNDERCVAAWLFGSVGRGTDDELSDLDIWIVVRDADCPAIVAERRAFVSQIAPPIHIQEAPQNAPKNGGFLLTLYAGEAGLQHIDWYWQPQSSAQIPEQVRLLFDRANLPYSGLPPLIYSSPAPQNSVEEAEKSITFFWSMAPIAAKYIARRNLWQVLSMLMMLRGTLGSIGTHLQIESLTALDSPPADTPEGLLALLRQMAESVQNTHPVLEAQGGTPPQEIVPHVLAYFDLVEAFLHNL